MDRNQSPFDILGISPEAELEVVAAAYKVLARKYHPDMNPRAASDDLNSKMARLNWAREELERDLAGWRKRAALKTSGQHAQQARARRSRQTGNSSGRAAARKVATVIEPLVVSLPGRKGAQGTFTVTAKVDHAQIRARFPVGKIEVIREASVGASAIFSITVVEDFPSQIHRKNLVETIDVIGPRLISQKLFVNIIPVSTSSSGEELRPRAAHSAASLRWVGTFVIVALVVALLIGILGGTVTAIDLTNQREQGTTPCVIDGREHFDRDDCRGIPSYETIVGRGISDFAFWATAAFAVLVTGTGLAAIGWGATNWVLDRQNQMASPSGPP